MGNEKKNNYKNVDIPWPKKTGKTVGGPLWDGEKNKESGKYIGSTPAFPAVQYTACMHVIGNKEKCEYRSLHQDSTFQYMINAGTFNMSTSYQ